MSKPQKERRVNALLETIHECLSSNTDPHQNAEQKKQKLSETVRKVCEMLKGKTNDEDEQILKLHLLKLIEKIGCESEYTKLREALIHSDLVEFLIKQVKDTKSKDRIDLEMREIALKVIRSLSLLENGRQMLINSQSISTLVCLIDDKNETLSCLAIRTMFSLSVVDVRIRHNIVQAGALPLLLRAALEYPHDEKFTPRRCAAVGTLANLATEADIKRSIVRDFSGLKPLIKLLDSDNELILTHTCRALFAIAANDENKLEIAKAGGLSKLLHCITSIYEPVKMNAAGALANLAIHPENKVQMVQNDGALEKLRATARSKDEKTQRQVARCFFALAAHVENRRKIVEKGCLNTLLDLLQSCNEDVQLNAAGAIGNISMTDEYKEDIVRCGAFDELVRLAQTSVEQVKRQVVRAIFTLTAKEIAKHKLAEMDGLRGLICLLDNPNEEIQRDAAGAIANVAIGTTYKSDILERGGLKPLTSLLSSYNVSVQKQSARAMFALTGTGNNQIHIIKCGGIPALVSLLNHRNEDVLKHACGAIANITIVHPSEVVQEPEALKALVGILFDHRNLEVRRQAARAIYNISPSEKQPILFTLGPYGGISGEQQRLRHDMRIFFHETMQNQKTKKIVRSSKHELSQCIQMLQTGSLEVVNTSSDACSDSKRSSKYSPQYQGLNVEDSSFHVTDSDFCGNYDVRLLLPLSGCDEVKTRKVSSDQIDTLFLQNSEQSSPSPRLRMYVEPKSESGNGVKKSKSPGSDRHRVYSMHPSISDESDISHMTMEISGHLAILASRWTAMEALLNQENDVPQDGAKDKYPLETNLLVQDTQTHRIGNTLYVCLPEYVACHSKVWMAFLEYLYTDSIRLNYDAIKTNGNYHSALHQLATRFGIKSLQAYCLNLEEYGDSMNPQNCSVRSNSSVWVTDMYKLLQGTLCINAREKIIAPANVEFSFAAERSFPINEFGSLHQKNPSAYDTPKQYPEKRRKTDDSVNFTKKKSFGAHKEILASRCSYFKAQFSMQSKWKDRNASIVEFSGSEETLFLMLRYIYCGVDDYLLSTLRGNTELALKALAAANRYNLDGLQLQCERVLVHCLSKTNIHIILPVLSHIHAPLLRCIALYDILYTQNQVSSETIEILDDIPELKCELEQAARKWGFCLDED